MYGVTHDAEDLYFLVTDPEWFDLLISKPRDGLAIDIIDKEQYPCGSPNQPKSEYIRGFDLPPVYKKYLDANRNYTFRGDLIIKVGEIPPEFFGREIEFNIIVLQNRRYCHYLSNHAIGGHKWELLETGLFADTLAQLSGQDRAIVLDKSFQFEIPFEKNKYQYHADDIQPIYDSLLFYKYHINSMEIEAYSSLEGGKSRNQLLQKKRAQSIVRVFESFQRDTIQTTIKTSENWVDFFNDIEGTPFSNWQSLSKGAIKRKLKDPKILEQLEPLLSDHRKAIIRVKLEKKINLTFSDQKELVQLFNQSIHADNVSYALEIQRSAYQYVQKNVFPDNLMQKLEVPLARPFALLYNNKIVYEYLQRSDELQAALSEFEKLLEIVPDNPQVLYNIYSLRLKSWGLNAEVSFDRKELLKGLKSLESKGLNAALANRLLINYYILLSEKYQHQRKYRLKNDLLKKIYATYEKIDHNSDDALSIAKYLVGYQKYKWAISLLKPYLNDIYTPEDLLFFYINLTIVKPKPGHHSKYKALLLNAINKNTSRFCGLFDPMMYGGVSFQLLEDVQLKELYCSYCQ